MALARKRLPIALLLLVVGVLASSPAPPDPSVFAQKIKVENALDPAFNGDYSLTGLGSDGFPKYAKTDSSAFIYPAHMKVC